MIKTPKNNIYVNNEEPVKEKEALVPAIKTLEQKGQIGKFESGSSSENFTNIYQNNLAGLTKKATSFVIDNMNDDQLEMIVREGEEIDESIERLECSILKLRGKNVEVMKESDVSVKAKVPKLDFKRLKSHKKRKKRKKGSSGAFYSQFGYGKFNK